MVAACDVEVRPVPDFPGYFARSDGVILSSWRKGPGATATDTPRRIVTGSPHPRSGHIRLHMKNINKWSTAHQLVMLAFVGPCPDGLEVRHRNGNPQDNSIGNLCYGTRQQNALDMVSHGRHSVGWRNKKLTPTMREHISSLRSDGFGRNEIARIVGLSETHTSRVLKGEI